MRARNRNRPAAIVLQTVTVTVKHFYPILPDVLRYSLDTWASECTHILAAPQAKLSIIWRKCLNLTDKIRRFLPSGERHRFLQSRLQLTTRERSEGQRRHRPRDAYTSSLPATAPTQRTAPFVPLRRRRKTRGRRSGVGLFAARLGAFA